MCGVWGVWVVRVCVIIFSFKKKRFFCAGQGSCYVFVKVWGDGWGCVYVCVGRVLTWEGVWVCVRGCGWMGVCVWFIFSIKEVSLL